MFGIRWGLELIAQTHFGDGLMMIKAMRTAPLQTVLLRALPLVGVMIIGDDERVEPGGCQRALDAVGVGRTKWTDRERGLSADTLGRSTNVRWTAKLPGEGSSTPTFLAISLSAFGRSNRAESETPRSGR